MFLKIAPTLRRINLKMEEWLMRFDIAKIVKKVETMISVNPSVKA